MCCGTFANVTTTSNSFVSFIWVRNKLISVFRRAEKKSYRIVSRAGLGDPANRRQ